MEIISSALKQDISRKIGKNIEELVEDDLLKIDRVILRSEDFLGNKTDYIIDDLKGLKNVKECSVFLFNITEKDVKIIQEKESLKYIQFDFCDFKTENLYLGPYIENVFINNCKNISNLKISGENIKEINIIGSKEKKNFDILNLVNIKSLEKLKIHNFNIKGIDHILDTLPELKKLNIDGSDTEEDLTELRQKIIISQNKFYHLT